MENFNRHEFRETSSTEEIGKLPMSLFAPYERSISMRDVFESGENSSLIEADLPKIGLKDDNGKVYTNETCDKLLPNTKYTLNGNDYKTDEHGRIISCESNPQRTPDNLRDRSAQVEVGGKDRRDGDQGGHITARDLGGDSGMGNLIAMDSRINQSDYKRMENDIKKALDEGKDVKTKTDISYSGDSERPDKIISTVTIDGKDTVYTFDNNLDDSLMDKLKETGSESDIKTVQDVLDETKGQISSTKEEYNKDGNLEKTTVMVTYTYEDGYNYRLPVVINHGGISQ